jgi:NitT/TauT family transport system permease protein
MSTTISAADQAVPDVAAPSTRDETSRMRQLAITVIPPLLVFLLFIGIWFLASHVLVHKEKRFLLPPPDQVFHDGFLDGYFRSEIFSGLWLTTKAALIGLALSIGIGTAVAVAMSQAKWIERSLFPYAVVLQTIPVLAITPLIGITLGFDFSSRVFVCVLISLFPIITNTLFGLLSAERGMHDLFTLHKASRWTRLLKLQFPAALPAIFTGFRISAGLSVIGAVVGDTFFQQGDRGIGTLIVLYGTNSQITQMYWAVIVSSLLGVAVFVLVGFAQRRAVGRWHEITRAGS